MEGVIEHFSHKHLLKLVVKEVEESKCYTCYGCGFTFSSTMVYACSEEDCYGKVYLCTLCAHLPLHIQHHPLHPNHGHMLRLVNQSPYTYTENWCDACGGKIPSHECLLFYHCNECKFDLHAHCAHSLRPTLRYAAHDHLLTLVHTNYISFYHSWNCKSCESRLLDGVVFVQCVECRFKFHIECFKCADVDGRASLPDATTKHLVQGHSHPLTLVTDDECFSVQNSKQCFKYFFCNACKKWDWPQHWVYKCMECNNFTSHLSCPIQFPNNIFLYTDLSPGINNSQCQGCKKQILKESPTYGCEDPCKLFLHDSCLQQWQARDEQIHPFHPQHPLKFMFNHGKQLTCTCCIRKCSGFIFYCQYCPYGEFILDLDCMLLVPSLQHQDHHDRDHLLVLLDKVGSYRKTSYLRCVECRRRDFSIEKCLLPYTIQHPCHFHPLTLVPRLVDDINQCYCDACEEKRDPDECIYYCGECKFEVHIGCVKFEVLNASRNCKLKAVKFVTPKQIIEEEEEAKLNKKEGGQHVILLKEVLLPLNNLEVEEIKNVLKLASNRTWETSLGEIPSYDNKISTKILFSDEPFKLFVSKLNSVVPLEVTHEMVLSFLKEKDEVVYVGEYLAPLNFEHILETLFAKYGDFGAKCTLSPKTKQYLFLAFCKVLQSMCDSKVMDVTEGLLIEWWVYFAIGKASGFKIQFAFDSMKRIIYAHFGLQADKKADRKLTDARIEMRALPQKIKELEKELQKTRERFEIVKIEENELRIASFRAKKSHLMRKCLMEAEDLACYSGGEVLFPPME